MSTDKVEELALEGGGAAKYFHPDTGEEISKNAWKKLQKGEPVKKEKKEKPLPTAASEAKEKVKKPEKEAEVIYVDNTPPGEKKRQEEFPPTYQPKYVEAAWQTYWETKGYYSPNVKDALAKPASEKFIMVLPPPNVTGSLHLGHALTVAIEDTITRWHRMKGKVVCWLPGTDHAGIATQSVVEKRLMKEENLSRRDLGRDKFIDRVWQWKKLYGGKICNQIRSLGASVDWSREAFTMDENLSRAVTEAFVRFHEDGIMYRATRLVNWSCALKSAISDIEVDKVELEGKVFRTVPGHTLHKDYEFGTLSSFAYKVEGLEDEIVVATTRLETMLGDTAVAVHPNDPRYAHLHGKFVVHPFVNRRIPIITDATLVDMTFGTGAVKITPAHDPNDYACGKRHGLDFIVILTEDGKIAANGGKYAGMMRYDARRQMEADMKELGCFREKVPNKMVLPVCSRSGDIIEPMLTPQWYVNCSNMAERAIEAVRTKELKILPEMHEQTWYRWLENIQDWCVSRQLWWGHRIPAYFCRIKGEARLDKNESANNDRWIVARTIDAAAAIASTKFNTPLENIELEQDEDVLDTWFSSGIFPFSVFGWPNNTDDFKAFYPTQLLETGLDILFFWVARMVMMGLQLTNTLPFSTVYLHAMVRDKYGRKMSKSLGNVIDPLEVINSCPLVSLLSKIDEGNLPRHEVEKAKEIMKKDFPNGIAECGTDGLRFGMLAYTVQGRDINLDIQRVLGYRQFCNKVWNATRFALTYVSDYVPESYINTRNIVKMPDVSTRDLFILSKLNNVIRECNVNLGDYLFGAVTSALHSFFMYDLCDNYLEFSKPIFKDDSPENANRKRAAQATLYAALEIFLRLTHPIMPFVTEELWQRLPNRGSLTQIDSIMISPYPETFDEWRRPDIEANMEIVKEAIHVARSIRTDYKIANHVKPNFYYRCTGSNNVFQDASLQLDFCTLARGERLAEIAADLPIPKGCCVKVINEQTSLLIDLTGIIDIDIELARLTKEVDRLQPIIDNYKKKMSASDYEKVPEKVRLDNKDKLDAYDAELQATLAAKAMFEAMK